MDGLIDGEGRERERETKKRIDGEMKMMKSME